MSAGIQAAARSQIASGVGVGPTAKDRKKAGKDDGSAEKDKEKEKEPDEERVEEDNHEDLLSYSKYRPAKLKFGVAHPDPVVENASLAAVPPPEITCKSTSSSLVSFVFF